MSGFRIMSPIMIGSDNIVSTNVAFEDEWVAGTYNLGDQRRVGEVLYEVSAATTTQEPSPTSTEWFSVGPINRLSAFDLQFGVDKYAVVETKTVRDTRIQYTLNGLSRISGAAFFGLSAATVRIVATKDVRGDIFSKLYELSDANNYTGSYWRYWFLPRRFPEVLIDFDMNIPQGVEVEITIERLGGTAEVGVIALGIVSEFGTVVEGSGVMPNSPSIRRTDGLLRTLLQRTPSRIVKYSVICENFTGNALHDELSKFEGLGVVTTGPSNHSSLTCYGAISKHPMTILGNGVTRTTIEVDQL